MNNVEVDRISSLPDEVLTHILSFLSTEDAVQTCVLSKRWKNTWAAVPILNINHKHFLINGCREEDYDCSGDSDEEQRIDVARSEFNSLGMSAARFQQFMTGFLDNRPPTNLERVNCVCNFQCWDRTHASMGWLDRVVLLMPLQIHIGIMGGGFSLDIPDLVFSCASLQHLSMSLSSLVKTIISPVSINLPSLKFLHLSVVEFHDDFAEKLFMGCPSLQKLDLSHCDLYFSSISSKVLKELTLISCNLYEQMQISCLNLVSLSMLIDLARGDISLKNISSLVDAVIELDLGDDVPNLNILGSLSNVAELKLYLVTPVLKEQLEKDIPNCINFNNLKKLVLEVRWDMCSDFYLIACLLKHSPNLKELELLLDESQGQIQEPRREISEDVLFQYEYLETVKIGPECEGELSSELINAIIKTLGRYVKKIGNLIIA
ncbi:F-box/LRR-repeat protein [Carex littledalei]|uniref:F-box/LRR-repeat protein n=1 Tax=Carex littledalei TaxID=544730 RepID=A0A833RD74_9POAL|nr:F-box/LRR-repeat protein [Carex littledalei]